MKIDHIGIAVWDLDQATFFYEEILGLKKIALETVAEQEVRIAFFQLGENKIELLEPLSMESPIAKYLAKRGEGIHHLALRVEGLKEKVRQMQEEGIRFIGDKPSLGADKMKIIFIHPKFTAGVLLELCEQL